MHNQHLFREVDFNIGKNLYLLLKKNRRSRTRYFGTILKG